MTLEKKRSGRPRKSKEDQVALVGLPNRTIEILDRHIERQAMLAGDWPLVSVMGSKNLTGPERHQLSRARRDSLVRLIDAEIGPQAEHRRKVLLKCPASGSASEMREAADWMLEQEAALLKSAPPAVKNGVEGMRLRHELEVDLERRSSEK